jgi:AraC family transcriptional regulator
MQHLQRTNYGSPEQLRRLGGLQISTTPYEGGSTLPWHEHDEAYLCLVAAGGYSQQSGGTELDCQPGLLLAHPEDAPAAALAGNRVLFRLIAANNRLPGADRLLARIERELRATDDAAPLALQSAVLELIALACRAGDEQRRPAWLQRVVQRLHDDPSHTPSLNELATLAGVHPSHLARSFQRMQGVSVGEYQRGIRIELARKALRDGRRSIAEIAAEAGFSDQSHFARVFRRATGQTPREFRQTLQTAC